MTPKDGFSLDVRTYPNVKQIENAIPIKARDLERADEVVTSPIIALFFFERSTTKDQDNCNKKDSSDSRR
jgi:hypothetical protein